MYYASASGSDNGGSQTLSPDQQQASSSASYVQQDQQHFVVISNNNNNNNSNNNNNNNSNNNNICVNEDNVDKDDNSQQPQRQQSSASDGCNCASGYAMSCDFVDCVNKYQQHNQTHLSLSTSQPPQQIIVSESTSREPIISYSMPISHHDQPSTHQQQLAPQNFHDISQSIDQVTSAVDSKKGIVSRSPVDEKELRRQRLAEMARLRYQNLSKEEKKAVNSRRMLLRKRKRQREREMEELEAILRSSNDIEEDVVFIGELREKRQRENRARAARSRYHSMTPEERCAYNQKRRMRQLGLLNGSESTADSESLKEQIAQQNARKAELARQRYHRMSIEERKLYNKRRTESLRRRRLEEETLLATPAGQIDSDALQRAQQIMIRNAMRAEKARERYKRKAPDDRERKRTRQSDSKMVKQERMDHNEMVRGSVGHHHSRHRADSGDILSVIEREVERRTVEARHVLEQKARTANDSLFQQIKQEPNLSIHHHPQVHQPEVINLCASGPTLIQNHHVQPGTQFATAQTIVHAAPPGATAGTVVMPGDVKPTTKYVSYMQLPAGTTQSGFLLADGQFVALQEPIQSYAIEQPGQGGFDGNFQHINPTAVLRTSNGGQQSGQPIIIGQRVELINAGEHQTYHPQHVSQPNTIHVVNYGGGFSQHQHVQQALPQHQQHIVTQHLPPHVVQQQPQHQQYATIQHHNTQTVLQHQQQQPQVYMIPTSASTSSGASIDPQMDDKVQLQRAKRAERARRRYHEMSAEARHEFNAKRALALKMSRLKDEELCRLGDELDMTHREVDEDLRQSIDQARIRRAKRAETARQKYQKMTPEQRKIHNAMRDAQRRQRKREIEESGGVKPPS